jgi:hypothetical protein
MNDRDLQASVTAELDCDPKIDGGEIAVFADGGVVTLRGTVASSGQKHLAQTAAWRVDGVSGIRNLLLVRALDSGNRAEASFRADVLQAFKLDTVVPRQRACPDW